MQISIPGGTESYILDARGDKHPCTQQLWLETYVSALIRAILYSDDHLYPLRGFRKLDPTPDLVAEKRFLEAAKDIFWRGVQLGTDAEIQIATNARNHLTRALMRYFGDSWRWEIGVEFLLPLVQVDADIGALLAKAYFGMDEEVKGVRVLHECVRRVPNSYTLLLEQVEFLRRKEQLEGAKELARFAVDAAPSEFCTWAALTDVLCDLEDTRNVCFLFFEALNLH